MDENKVKELLDEYISKVDEIFNIRQKLYHEMGGNDDDYSDALFDFFNDISDGTYSSSEEALEAWENIKKDMDRE